MNLMCPFLASFSFTEAIQSRCAILRYTKLSDGQILSRLMEICDKEKVIFHYSTYEVDVYRKCRNHHDSVCELEKHKNRFIEHKHTRFWTFHIRAFVLRFGVKIWFL